MVLRAGSFQFQFPRPAVLMGIVNVTPDSFSDGGRFQDPAAAAERALALAEEGAEIIDIGGESTRPGAVPVSEGEELRRVLPVLERLRGRIQALLSIDTYKPQVAREALRAGAGMVNDIGANRADPEMWQVVAEHGAGYIAMHMQGRPATMQVHPAYADVRREVASFFEDRLAGLAGAGVALDQVALDVGIGFGKTRRHNLELVAGLGCFARFGRPLVLGVSRKSFLGDRGETRVEERLPAALACSSYAVQTGVQILRTHDVKRTLQAVRMTEEILRQVPGPG
jgi:dihydropteroate synthase